MRNWIRDWLGLTTMQRQMTNVANEVNALRDELVPALNSISVIFNNEHSDARKELSHKIGDKALATMLGEDKARRHTLGEI